MYANCIFDLYGTLVDIHTDETASAVWEKLALFYGYYGAAYAPQELRAAYEQLSAEGSSGPQYSHEAHPEIRIETVFAGCSCARASRRTTRSPSTPVSSSACSPPTISVSIPA